jgi:hypothetical protein
MSFKEWLKIKELATTTASIATYTIPVGAGLVRRPSLQGFIGGYPEKKSKKRKPR